jgi:hypothetical protein
MTDPIKSPEPAKTRDEGAVKIEDYIVSVNGTSVSCDGPLAKAYSEALSVLYKKDVDPETGLALETQANDVLSAQKEIEAAAMVQSNVAFDDENLSLLYGVQKGLVTPEHVIDVTDHFSRMSDEAKQRSAVVMDVTVQPGVGNPTVSTKGMEVCGVALEQLCARHRVPVLSSLAQYVKLSS